MQALFSSSGNVVVYMSEQPLSASVRSLADTPGAHAGVTWIRVETPFVPGTTSNFDLAADPSVRFAQEWRTEHPFTQVPTRVESISWAARRDSPGS